MISKIKEQLLFFQNKLSLIKSRYNEKAKIYLSVLLVIIFLILVVISYCIKNSNLITQKEKDRFSLTFARNYELSEIEKHLNSLAVTVSHNNSTKDVRELGRQLQNIEQTINSLKSNAEMLQLKELVTDSKDQITSRLGRIQNIILQIKDQMIPKKYLPSSALPFQVLGIDMWNGQPKVTLELKGELAPPLGINEIQDGWTLKDLQFTPPMVFFENDKGQQVKLGL